MVREVIQADPNKPLDEEKVAEAVELQDLLLILFDGRSSKVVINALVNALATVYTDAMINADFDKAKVLAHLSKAIDHHFNKIKGESSAN